MDYGDTVHWKISSLSCNTEINFAGFETSRNMCIVKHDCLASCHPEIML